MVTVSAGRLSCVAKPADIWFGVQGTFVVSGVETLTISNSA
jgi:hypothetical protein